MAIDQSQKFDYVFRESIKKALQIIADEESELAVERFKQRGKEVCVKMSVEMMSQFDIAVNQNRIIIEFKEKK